MLEAKTAHDVAAKILPSDPDWYEAMEVDASQARELVNAGVEWFDHAEEEYRVTHMGMLDMDAEIKQVTAKGSGIVVQIEPKGYMPPEDNAALIALMGKRIHIRAHDPEQPLPLDYFEHGDDEEGE